MSSYGWLLSSAALVAACSNERFIAAPEGADAGVTVDGGSPAPPAEAGISDGDAGADAAAPSGAVRFPGTGHYYLVVAVEAGIDWTQAKARSEALGGHLATISSGGELGFIWDLVKARPLASYDDGGNFFGPWLGGYQPAGSTEPGGGWAWVTGEPWSFTAWSPAEPSNSYPAEEFLHFYSYGSRRAEWSDGPDTNRIRGYVVEIE